MSNSFNKWLKGFMLRRIHNMITCEEFESFILDYLDDGLPAAQKITFELHLKICAECREYLAAYKNTIGLCKAVLRGPHVPVPDDVPEDLIKAILDARDK
jgi:anti-sigma factor RsiW